MTWLAPDRPHASAPSGRPCRDKPGARSDGGPPLRQSTLAPDLDAHARGARPDLAWSFDGGWNQPSLTLRVIIAPFLRGVGWTGVCLLNRASRCWSSPTPPLRTNARSCDRIASGRMRAVRRLQTFASNATATRFPLRRPTIDDETDVRKMAAGHVHREPRIWLRRPAGRSRAFRQCNTARQRRTAITVRRARPRPGRGTP